MPKESEAVLKRTSLEARNIWSGYSGKVTNSLRMLPKENVLPLPFHRQGPPTFVHHVSTKKTSRDVCMEIMREELSKVEEEKAQNALQAQRDIHKLLKINAAMATYLKEKYR